MERSPRNLHCSQLRHELASQDLGHTIRCCMLSAHEGSSASVFFHATSNGYMASSSPSSRSLGKVCPGSVASRHMLTANMVELRVSALWLSRHRHACLPLSVSAPTPHTDRRGSKSRRHLHCRYSQGLCSACLKQTIKLLLQPANRQLGWAGCMTGRCRALAGACTARARSDLRDVFLQPVIQAIHVTWAGRHCMRTASGNASGPNPLPPTWTASGGQ